MALDAIFLSEVINEIKPQIEGLRIEKIQMPSKDQVVLLLRGNRRLLLCCNPNQARIHLTQQLRDNPQQPPMFCMLLRKYIGSGKIVSVVQERMERVVTLNIDATDEMGEQSTYQLIMECMGRHSNVVLVGKDGRILDAIRHVDFEMSPDRQVMPGLFYQFPLKKDLKNPLTIEEVDFVSLFSEEETDLSKWLTATFVGISPLIAREIEYRSATYVDTRGRARACYDALCELRTEERKPYVLTRDGKYNDFTYIYPRQYENYYEISTENSYSDLLDSFFQLKEQQERVRQRGQDLIKLTNNLVNRTKKKLALQQKDLEDTKNREKYRIYGDLITSNLYRLNQNCSSFSCENYFEEGCPTIQIPMDQKVSPQKNAQNYYKKYNKLKTAENVLTELIEKGKKELDYFNSVMEELNLSESEQDFLDVRQELMNGGYIRSRSKKEQKGKVSKPRQFMTSSGYPVLVGRNNAMNEKLSLKQAGKYDLWFHTKSVHGSHVILCLEDENVDERTIFEAATIAAYYSQARESGKISVDYTPARYLKKPNGGFVGQVIYHTNQTIEVTPDTTLVKSLAVK